MIENSRAWLPTEEEILIAKMYCLQWLIPVLLIPKPLNPALLYDHVMFMSFYLASFFLERKPCTICSLVFLFALFFICYRLDADKALCTA